MKCLSTTLISIGATLLLAVTTVSGFTTIASPQTSSLAFIPSNTIHRPLQTTNTPSYILSQQPTSLQRQRHAVAPVTTMGLFGLGAPEIAIILVAAAFLLGPEKLAEFSKDAGKIAGELKEVPKEFQKGLAEGETEAKATKAKIMESETAEKVEKSE